MAYFADLTPYTYFTRNEAGRPNTGVLNVGWLDKEQPFETGTPSAEFLNALAILHRYPQAQTRGWHTCPFCCKAQSTAEIRARGADGTVYAAPQMILHYVTEHRYAPPQAFVDAALRSAREVSCNEFIAYFESDAWRKDRDGRICWRVHKWGSWSRLGADHKRVCRRCGLEQVK